MIGGRTRPTPGWLVDSEFEDERVGLISGGKEAKVWLIRRHFPCGRWCLLAAKKYLPRYSRAFRRDLYIEGRRAPNARLQKALTRRTHLTRPLVDGLWLRNELDVMRRLWAAGARVPYPVGHSNHGLLMQYLGSGRLAAPRLKDANPDRATAIKILDELFEQIRVHLSVYVVHADLSPYNVLVLNQKPWIIDFPQAVDVCLSPHWAHFLVRDLFNLESYFSRLGLGFSVRRVAAELVSSTHWGYRTDCDEPRTKYLLS